jgi:hypothetical protein
MTRMGRVEELLLIANFLKERYTTAAPNDKAE